MYTLENGTTIPDLMVSIVVLLLRLVFQRLHSQPPS